MDRPAFRPHPSHRQGHRRVCVSGGSLMSAVIPFPTRKRRTASSTLRDSALARPCQRLETNLIIEDSWLAEAIITAAGYAQQAPDKFIIRSLRAMFGGG